MSTYHRRFVGATQLPKLLSEFDVEHFFRLLPDDVTAIRERFRADRRLGPALQLVVLRATGRPLDRVSAVPKTLLRHLSDALNLANTSIASLRSIYKRRETLYDHQKWARDRAGLEVADDAELNDLQMALTEFAKNAASVHDLVDQAMQWLFDKNVLIPADRTLRDLARVAYAHVEKAAIAAIKKVVNHATLLNCHAALYEQRGDVTVLEWLKTAVGRHGPTTLAEATEKIAFLKALGVHSWNLDSITAARQRAYAQATGRSATFGLETSKRRRSSS